MTRKTTEIQDMQPDEVTQQAASTAALSELVPAAEAVLHNNARQGYTVPAQGLYPHQWLWDSCFIAIGLRHVAVHRAQQEILHLLSGQWSNGMVPHILLSERSDQRTKKHFHNDRNERIWRSWLNPNAPHAVYTSGITQPPLLAPAALAIGQVLRGREQKEWYRLTYPGLVKYHEWLNSERDPHHEGLTLQVHPWETGLDNTPPWMSELHDHLMPWWIRAIETTHFDTIIGRFRSDQAFVGRGERMTTVEALALYDVQRRLRRKRYDFNEYIDHSLFAVEDLTFNAVLIRANDCLGQIAAAITADLPVGLVAAAEKTAVALEDGLYDQYSGQYYSRDFVSHRLLKVPSIATFMPLYAGTISKKRAAGLVQLLEDTTTYGATFPVPSVPLSSDWFNERRYWQGPTWINMNWFIIQGLRRYGYDKLAEQLRLTSLGLISQSGFYEYFNPLSGEGYGTNNFSWTASLAIDLLKADPASFI